MEGLSSVTFFSIAVFEPFYHGRGESIPKEYTDTRVQFVQSYKNTWALRFGTSILACLMLGMSVIFPWGYFSTFWICLDPRVFLSSGLQFL